jgi:phenylacetic acid degradation operon negative regulatory protein
VAEQHTPRSLIITFYGAYRREWEGPVPVAGLIRLLGALDVDPPSVRSSVSRLKRRGLLVPERTPDGAAGYSLSASARQLLDDGDRRIYPKPGSRTRRTDGWVLAVFSVPEQERHKRHLLRSRLAGLGYGTAAPGVWIAPEHVLEETRHTLQRLELSAYVDLFTGTHRGFEPTAEAVARWWDLTTLAKLHQSFLDVHGPVLERWERAQKVPPADAYRDYLLVLDSWRQLPYADPGLPEELLPPGWPGARSVQVFRALHEMLRDAGAEFVHLSASSASSG